ncbi:hypothetical protein GPX89_03930 [Nocardia sp. ET3-3]|uniref:PucR family transcriptional regulator n=1 Tax=Nocardia terrae TaxID=2675851 RepID=A0A7K1UPX2_9NOCA|nr:PucR family transcriptional regulator [Nocardia terrae]MVU76392.1 hypothetical protein [Nocardia terrae]
MLVEQVLELSDLGVAPMWAPRRALRRTVTGVTTVDVGNPASYLSPGEIVLTGLAWWQPQHAESVGGFVAAARAAGTVALIAGEGVHGRIPEELVEACRRHGLPLFSVPCGTTFRAIVDRIYLRLWSDMRASDSPALPSTVMDELWEAITSAAPLDELLATAVERLGLPPLELASASGRVIAASGPGAADATHPTRLGVGPAPRSPFDGWFLRTGRVVSRAQQPVLDELATLLSRAFTTHRALLDEQATATAELLAALEAEDAQTISATMHELDLGADDKLTPLVVRIPGAPDTWAVDAVHELLAGTPGRFVVCANRSGEAIGLTTAPTHRLTDTVTQRLATIRTLLAEDPALAVGIGPSADTSTLTTALARAQYAADAAEQRPPTSTRVCTASEMTNLSALLEGLPTAVSQAFQTAVIGPIVDYDAEKGAQLLETLQSFLNNDGSWTRTSAAMHLHVNTIHYRIERIEALTGRRVLDPQGRLDLYAALTLHQRGAA